MFYVSRVELENFRCFESVTVEADVTAPCAPWTLLTGDNASGKTTLLKAIALGLCDRSSAAGLLRESDSGYIRDGQESSTIKICLVERVHGQTSGEYCITTRLDRRTSHLENLDQETEPKVGFPWDRIFVCGYGAGRGTSGTGDIAGYTSISAVYNLFNYGEGLQNPELTIRRLHYGSRRQQSVLKTAQEILQLPDFRLAENGASEAGISVTDPRGVDVALRDLADGYKSTFLWITDFLGWAFDVKAEDQTPIEGIVVIDEIEQHLHPRWQKRIVRMLQKAWPQVQFFAATHSPLVARSFTSVTDRGPHRHYHLRDSEDGTRVESVPILPLGGKRTDQILASEAFDYLIDDDPDSEQILEELSFLAGNEFLTIDQKKRANELLEIVQQIQSMRTGQTEIERSAAFWAEMTRRSMINHLEHETQG